jgi:hypothetical protein
MALDFAGLTGQGSFQILGELDLSKLSGRPN